MMDTIMAPLTPLIRSAVILLRISGDLGVVLGFFSFKGALEPRKTLLATFRSKSASLADQVLLTYFKAPHSYTGEDVLEISFHGNPLIAKTALKDFEKAGVRYAERGEFTRRALTQKKLTVARAEAIEALTSSPTVQGTSLAFDALEGKLDGKFQALQKSLLELLASIEADIDFSEELEKSEYEDADKKREESLGEVNRMLAQYERARFSLFGAKVVIAGPVNSGKSTLYNALLEEDAAIVSAEEGTTRDINKAIFQLAEGITVSLIDTAGVRSTESLAEKEGIKRTERAVKEADLLIELITPKEQCAFQHKNKITALSKKDLYGENIKADVYVSAKTGEGLRKLSAMIHRKLGNDDSGNGCDTALISERQRVTCEKIHNFLELSKSATSLDISAYEVRNALSCLGELTGTDITEETLSVIFSRFCIGK